MLKKLLVLGLMIGSILGFADQNQQNGNSKQSRDLPKSGPPIEVIIQFKPIAVGNKTTTTTTTTMAITTTIIKITITTM